MADIQFRTFDTEGFAGYSVTNTVDGVEYGVAVVMKEGRPRAFHTVNSGERQGSWEEFASNAPGHAAYAMMSGARSETLLDLLAVRHVERDAVAAEISAGTAQWSANYLPGLVPDALAALARAPEKKLSTYEFLAVEGERGVARRQAAAAYPVLVDLFNSHFRTKLAIDGRKPLGDVLLPLLSDLAGRTVGNGVLKRLMSAPALPEGQRLAPVLRLASLVQVDWIPKSEQDWKIFYSLANALRTEAKVPDSAIEALVAGSKGNWTQFAQRCLLKAFPEPDHPAHDDPITYLGTAAMMVDDMLEGCTEHVVIPLVAYAQDADDVYLNASIMSAARDWSWDILCAGRNLPDVFDLARRFHQERGQLTEHAGEEQRLALLKSTVAAGGWPGLTGPVQAPGPDGLWLVPLTTPQELEDEGRRMSHCVGGYDSRSMSLSCHIVSVRSKDRNGGWTSHSTVEFEGITSAVPKLSQRQNKAHGNTVPDAKYRDAVSWYVRQIESGALKTNWDVMCAFRSDAVIISDHVERMCGFDWKDRAQLDGAVRPWANFVTKKYRQYGLDDLMDSEEAQKIIAIMTPAFLSADSAPSP